MNAYSNINATYSDPGGAHAPALVSFTPVTLSFSIVSANDHKVEHHWLLKELRLAEENGALLIQHQSNRWGNATLIMAEGDASVQLEQWVRRQQGSLFTSPLTKVAAIFMLAAALLAGIYVWVLPWAADRIAMGLSKDYEIRMGQQIYQQTLAAVEKDEERTRVINQFFGSLQLPHSYPVSITVVKGDVINAFALPGGPIIVYDAILESIKTPEELAALLAHELSHIEKRHTLRSIAGTLGRQLLVTMFTGGQNSVLGSVASQADALKGLQYSRALETEADNSGLALLAAQQINPKGMLWLIQMLQKQTGGQEDYSFLSTHPVFTDRMQNIREKIGSLSPGMPMSAASRQAFHQLYE